jgi:hypothetical protein
VGSFENFWKRYLQSFSAECRKVIVFYSVMLSFIPNWELFISLGSFGDGLKFDLGGFAIPGLLTHSPIEQIIIIANS